MLFAHPSMIFVQGLLLGLLLFSQVSSAMDDQPSSSRTRVPIRFGKPPLYPRPRHPPSLWEDSDSEDELDFVQTASRDHPESLLPASTSASGSSSSAGARSIEDALTAVGFPKISMKRPTEVYSNLVHSRLASRLAQYGRPGANLREAVPLPDVAHLSELRKHLWDTYEWQFAVFLHPTPDRTGRILGVPIISDEFHRKVFGDAWEHGFLPWAILEGYPERENTPPRLAWVAYLTDQESDHAGLIAKLATSHEGKKLSWFLEHAL